MLNTCENCGRYSVDKIISDTGDSMTCKFCGYTQAIKRLPLFIITGASGVGKSATSREMFKNKENDIVMESDILSAEDRLRLQKEAYLRIPKKIFPDNKR